VYSYCKVSTLTAVSEGTWSPTVKVDYKSYATLTCGDGYFAEGPSVAQCGSSGDFSDVSTTKCVSESSMTCGEITATGNGVTKYLNDSAVQYTCNTGYLLSGDQETYTCDSTTGLWSIVTASNPDGTPPTCATAFDAASREVTFTVTFATDTEWCSTESLKTSAETTLTAYLKAQNLATCLSLSQCEMTDFTCAWASDVLTIKFALNQLTDMSDAIILTDAQTAISAATLVLSLDASTSRKKRATDLLISSDAVAVVAATTCDTGYIPVDESCTKCGVGYGINADGNACTICAKGYYSDAESILACTGCSDSKTTTNTGSISADLCLDPATLCTVPADPTHGGQTPPAGSSITIGSKVNVSCDPSYSIEYQESTLYVCTGTPVATPCYSKYTARFFNESPYSLR